jgi:serine phosphatase RsbU (regulator of sigma subunit)
MSGLEQALSGLLDGSHLATLQDLPALVARHAPATGLYDPVIYLTDLQQLELRPLTDPRVEPLPEPGSATTLSVDTTLAGRAFQEVRILSQPDDDDHQFWWVPLLDGTERLGVIRVTASPSATPPDGVEELAAMVALLLVSQRANSDLYPRLVRARPMNVAAEMQWRLIPQLTFATPEVTVGAVIEPAYEVGGDTFDYALYGDTLHLAIFDAMGHDTSAGLTANLAMAACRNHRRQGMDLATTSDAIEQVLVTEFGEGTRYVTALLADLDVRTGRLSWVNRGHPLPVVIRGGRWSTSLSCPPAHPLGMDLGVPVTMCEEQLEPGDRLVLYTDGITEARSAQGLEFGLSRFVDFIIRHNAAGRPVPETLRRLIQNILTFHHGQLDDDATVLLIEWRGPDAAP